MSFIEHPYVCDGPGCGKRRQNDTNHWFVLWEIHFEMFPDPDHPPTTGVVWFPWLPEEAAKPGRKHACGVACATKLLERALAAGTLDLVVAAQQAAKEVKH